MAIETIQQLVSAFVVRSSLNSTADYIQSWCLIQELNKLLRGFSTKRNDYFRQHQNKIENSSSSAESDQKSVLTQLEEINNTFVTDLVKLIDSDLSLIKVFILFFFY